MRHGVPPVELFEACSFSGRFGGRYFSKYMFTGLVDHGLTIHEVLKGSIIPTENRSLIRKLRFLVGFPILVQLLAAIDWTD